MVQVLYKICATSGAGIYQLEIRKFLWSHRSEKETDLVIISGEETFKVHCAVILPLSSYLTELLPPSCSCTKPTIFLPPFSSHVLAAVLEMFYTGETAIAALQEYRVQVEEVFALFKIKAVIQNASEEHILYMNDVEDLILQDSGIISEEYNSGTVAVEVAEEIESNDEEESSFCKVIQSKVKIDENEESSFCKVIQSQVKRDENEESSFCKVIHSKVKIDENEESSFGKVIHSQVKIDENDNSVTPQDREESSFCKVIQFQAKRDEESSFCKVIQSQVNRDENDNSATPHDREEITPTRLNMYSFCLNEATGLFYCADNDGETATVSKNPVKMKTKCLVEHENETLATKHDDYHDIAPRDERNKLEVNENKTMGYDNVDETTFENNFENVLNVDCNVHCNRREVFSRYPKRRSFTKLNYSSSEEQQSSSNPKPKEQTSSKYDIETEYSEVCRGCNKSFKFILIHLSQNKNCTQVYSTQQLDELKQKAKERIARKRKNRESVKSEEYKESRRRIKAKYRRSEKGIENQKYWNAIWNMSEKGKESRKRRGAKFRMSEKGKEYRKRWHENRRMSSQVKKRVNKNEQHENNENIVEGHQFVNKSSPEESKGKDSKAYITKAKKRNAKEVADAKRRLDNNSSSEDN